MRKLTELYRRLVRSLERLDGVPKLLARLTLGVVFLQSGWGKVNHLDKVTAFFAELKIPAPGANAVFVSLVELVCGALLTIGLGARIGSILLAATMVVALVTAKRAEIHGFGDLFGMIEWTYLVLLVWLAFAGPGKASIDHALAKRVDPR